VFFVLLNCSANTMLPYIYTLINIKILNYSNGIVELIGFEPTTSSVQGKHSPN
jgi:hypothetical protein